MSKENKPPKSDDKPKTTAEKALSQILTTLKRIKDLLYKDFLNDFPSYMEKLPKSLCPDNKDQVVSSFEQFCNALVAIDKLNSKTFFETIIASLFTRMGYDITEFQDNKKLLELIRSILAIALKIAPLLQQIFGSKLTLMEQATDVKAAEESTFDVKEFFKDPELENIKNLKFDEKDNNKISALLNLIVDVIKLIKKYEDFEAKNVGSDESKQFEEYFNISHAQNKFPEHFFNHLFVLLLSKSKDIFADEFDPIVDVCQDEVLHSKLIMKITHNNNLGQEEQDELLNKILIIRGKSRNVAKLKKWINKIKDKAKKENPFVEENKIPIPLELTAQLKIANARLEGIPDDIFCKYNVVSKIFHVTYMLLEFLQIITKERILTAKYSLDKEGELKFPFPSPKKDDVEDKWFKDEWFKEKKVEDDVTTYTENKLPYKEVAEAVGSAVKKAKSGCPTVDVYVTRWKDFGDLFSNPVEYFNKLYPIKDSDDAEAFLSKIAEVVRSFNPAMPNYDSTWQMLYELLFTVKDKIAEFDGVLDNPQNPQDLKDKSSQAKIPFEKFEKFIIDLLKVLEGFTIYFKDKLSTAFTEYEKKTDENNIISKLKKEIDDLFVKYEKNENNEIVKNIEDADIQTIFITPMIQMLKDKAYNFEMFKDISEEEWKTIIESYTADTAGSDNPDGLFTSYKKTLNYFKENIVKMKTFDNEEGWNERFKGFVAQLKKDFETQTEKTPDKYDNLQKTGEEYLKYKLDLDLDAPPKIEEPFSDFNYVSYLLELSTKVKSLAIYDASLCYVRFRYDDILFDKLKSDSIVKRNKGSEEDIYKNNLKHLIASAFTACWPKMEKQIEKLVAKPLRKQLDDIVKKWAEDYLLNKESIKKIQEGTKSQLYYNENNLSDTITDTNVAKKLLLLNSFDDTNDKDGTNVKASLALWKDALQFALNLHKIVPDTIKDYLRNLINFPKIDELGLPESFFETYNLDLKNRFFAATLYNDYKKEDGNDTIEPDKLNASIGLMAFIGEREIKIEDKKEKVWGFYLLPKLKVDTKFPEIDLGETHSLQFSASATLNKDPDNKTTTDPDAEALVKDKFGVFLSSQNNKINADWIDGENLEAYLNLEFRRKLGMEAITIFDADFAGLFLDNYPQKLFVGYRKRGGDKKDGFDFGYLGKLKNLVFKLKLRELNDFFKMILSNDIEITIGTLGLGLSLQDGFDINGSFKVRIPINADIDLSIIKFSSLIIEAGSGDMRNIMTRLLTNFTVDFQGIALSFFEMGFGVDVNYMKPDGSFGELDLSPQFQFPSGISIAINLAAVKGVGIIKWNQEKEEFFGAVSLNIMDICGASMMILFNMKLPDGEEGFSFMGALSVFFSTGIQIGMGFAITAIGGSVGINRRIDIETLQKAVRDGSLGTVLFVQELEKNIDTVINNISSYYPIQKDQFFFGFLAQITWGTVLKIDAGLFIQAPNPVVIMLAGALHVSIADEAENLIAIHVYFIGGIDFSKGLFFDASIVNSQIVGLKLEGDMALRLYWTGAQKGFILSAGGFHPQFTPAAGFNLGKMKRLAIRLDYGDFLNISLETYFAITSNTVQFGAALQIKIGWDSVGIFGGLSFDALFYFKPFSFIIEARAYLAAKFLGCTLMAIDTSLSLGGPAPWIAKGSAKFSILFIKVNVDFKETWGKRQKDTEIEHISVIELLKNNFNEKSNWKIIVGDSVDQLVQFVRIENKDEDELIMQSSDQLSFSQDAVPLAELMVKFGEATPEDAKKIELAEVTINDTKAAFEETRSSFAPSMIRKYSNNEKLRLPSYEDMLSGFNLIEMPDADQTEATGIDYSELLSECQEIKPDIRNKWAEYVKTHSN